MPAGPIGVCWASGSWAATAWELDSWGEGGLHVQVVVTGARLFVVTPGSTSTGTNRPGNLVVKDPQAVNDPWGMDWTGYLEALGAGAVIQSSSWSISGPDALLTLDEEEVLTGDAVTQVYLSGGTLGRRYMVTNRIVTNTLPEVTDDRSFFVLVQHQ